MAQLEAMKRYVQSSGGTSKHTADQLIHGDDPSFMQNTSPTSAQNASPTSAQNASPTSAQSASPTSAKSSDQEEHDRHSKNKVFTKVKEKAKKLKNTLSKKKHSQDNIIVPSAVSLEDHNDKVDDEPEFYGAPMYESSQAPENVKEAAKQHPREDFGIPPKHVSPRKENEAPENYGGPMYESTRAPENIKVEAKQQPREDLVISREDDSLEKDNEDAEYYGAPMYESAQAPENVKEMAKQHPREDILISPKSDSPSVRSTSKEQEHTEIPKDEIALLEKVNTGRSAPASEGEKKATSPGPLQASKTIAATVTEKLAPAYAMASEATGMITSKIHNIAAATSAALSPKGSPKDDTKGSPKDDKKGSPKDATSISEKLSDKGVQVKEYLKQKLVPGEDEKALSEMISNSISPTKESSKKEMGKSVLENPRAPMPSPIAGDTSSPHIPLSTNAYEVVEEEHGGRILQAN